MTVKRNHLERGLQQVVHRSFDDLGVDAGDSVDGVGAHDAEVSHVDLLLVALLNQGHATQAVGISREERGNALIGEESEIQLYIVVYCVELYTYREGIRWICGALFRFMSSECLTR